MTAPERLPEPGPLPVVDTARDVLLLALTSKLLVELGRPARACRVLTRVRSLSGDLLALLEPLCLAETAAGDVDDDLAGETLGDLLARLYPPQHSDADDDEEAP